MPNVDQSIENRVLSRIYGSRGGAVFTPGDFIDLGSRRAVDLTLHRLVSRGTIRRLAHGLYDYPKIHADLGPLSPDPSLVAKAIAGKFSTSLQPTGAYAANLLGISTQVPARIVYLTDGRARTVKIGNQVIQLKNSSPKSMATAGRVSGLIIQAFRFLGKQHIDDKVITHLRRTLSDDDKKRLMKDLRYAPGWIAEHMRAIATEA